MNSQDVVKFRDSKSNPEDYYVIIILDSKVIFRLSSGRRHAYSEMKDRIVHNKLTAHLMIRTKDSKICVMMMFQHYVIKSNDDLKGIDTRLFQVSRFNGYRMTAWFCQFIQCHQISKISWQYQLKHDWMSGYQTDLWIERRRHARYDRYFSIRQ